MFLCLKTKKVLMSKNKKSSYVKNKIEKTNKYKQLKKIKIMKKNSVLVKQVLMSTLTAGIFSFSFALTSCSDDVNDLSTPGGEFETSTPGDYSQYEPYGLTYHNFDGEDDVQIMNADTTEIAVKKSLADKLGITNFENHPIGIWDSPSHLAYGRKALEQQLVGDTYILKVGKVTTAELIGDKAAQISTDLYVNNDAQAVATRAADNDIPEFAAKYVDDNNMVHPAAILYTDPYGYDKDYHVDGDMPSASATRAAQTGEYQYVTPEELLKDTRASIHPRILSIDSELEFDKKFQLGKCEGDSINVAGKIPVEFNLNYFLTLNGGIKWKGILPYPTIKKFETGFDGNFGFHPEFTIGFSKEFKLPEDKEKVKLASFRGYTFTFVIGVIPVAVTVNPNLYLKFDASVKGSAHLKCKYDYSNRFKAGCRYEGKWSTFKEFEELENEFTMFQPELEFSAQAGVGLFLAADVKIYDVAGPEIGVGPRLGAEASININPNGIDWNAEVKLTVQAWAGAKIEILGYEPAEWHETFDIVGPWTLLKFPSDGTEHKSPAKKQEEFLLDTYVKMFNEIDEKYDTTFLNRLENAVLMRAEVNNQTRDEAYLKVYEGFDRKLDPEKYSMAKGRMNFKKYVLDANNAETRAKVLETLKSIEEGAISNYDRYCKQKNIDEIMEILMANEEVKKARGNMSNSMVEYEVGLAIQDFRNQFNCEPQQTAEDLKWLVERAIKHLSSPTINKVYAPEKAKK